MKKALHCVLKQDNSASRPRSPNADDSNETGNATVPVAAIGVSPMASAAWAPNGIVNQPTGSAARRVANSCAQDARAPISKLLQSSTQTSRLPHLAGTVVAEHQTEGARQT